MKKTSKSKNVKTQKIFFMIFTSVGPWRTVSTIEARSIIYHRLRGSASPVLTATHHSYGSPRLSDFFSGSRLEVRPPNRFWRKMAQTTWIHARMILL